MPAGPSGAEDGHDGAPEAEAGGLGEPPRGVCATWRSSPPRPTSPQATRSPGSGTPRARRDDGQGHGQVGGRLDDLHAAGGEGEHVGVAQRDAGPLARARRARAPAGRGRRPAAERRGCGDARRRDTSACTSTSSGRLPSMAGTTTEPATPGRRSARKGAPASGTPTSPASAISNRPSSPVGPKRCLTARSRRRAWWRSPSKASTVSTTCSSTRGPARAPSLVTWPTRTTARPRSLASRTSRWAHARTWATEPGAEPTVGVVDGLDRVDDERASGATSSSVGERRGRGRVSATSHRPSVERRRGARPAAAPAGATPRPTRRARGPPATTAADLGQQRRLADARLAADERDRAGHEPAAEHPVELGDAGRAGRRTRRVDLGDRRGREAADAGALEPPTAPPAPRRGCPTRRTPGQRPTHVGCVGAAVGCSGGPTSSWPCPHHAEGV